VHRGQKVGGALRHPILVDYRGGAGGNISAGTVVQAEPDGYTVVMSL
jgi:tripartite-type tricarboxylate transporter receptor subunit TctC